MTSETQNPGGSANAAGGAACWSCGQARNGAKDFCEACGKLQPAAGVDHFAAFSLPRKLAIDPKELEKAFYRQSRKLHPDVFAGASEQEKQWSLEKSSQLNDAYRTLKDPISRTQYLLQLEGMERIDPKGKPAVPAELLEEVFELNMQLQEMKASRKMGEADPEGAAELESARARFESAMEQIIADLGKQWSAWDAQIDAGSNSPQRAEILREMGELLDRHSYISNLLRDVR